MSTALRIAYTLQVDMDCKTKDPSHNQGTSHSPSHGNGFSRVSGFNNVSSVGGIGLNAGSSNDPYQRSHFGYGISKPWSCIQSSVFILVIFIYIISSYVTTHLDTYTCHSMSLISPAAGFGAFIPSLYFGPVLPTLIIP